MNAPRPPAEEHDPDPDPEEPVTRWDVTACRCGTVIYRPVRRATWPVEGGWRHVGGDDVNMRTWT